MRPAPFLASLLLLAGAGGCDAFGGSESLGGGPNTFGVTGRTPAPGSSGVPVGASIVITFDGGIDESSVGSDAIALNGMSDGEFTIEGTILRFDPAAELNPGSSYAVTLSPELRGVNGHVLGTLPAWGFKTAGAPPPPDTLPPAGPRPR